MASPPPQRVIFKQSAEKSTWRPRPVKPVRAVTALGFALLEPASKMIKVTWMTAVLFLPLPLLFMMKTVMCKMLRYIGMKMSLMVNVLLMSWPSMSIMMKGIPLTQVGPCALTTGRC